MVGIAYMPSVPHKYRNVGFSLKSKVSYIRLTFFQSIGKGSLWCIEFLYFELSHSIL